MSMEFENVGAFVRECNNKTLRYDEACLRIITQENVKFLSQYTECDGCILLETARFPPAHEIILKTTGPLQYAIQNDNGQICNGTYTFGEFGQYAVNLTDVTSDRCQPRMTAEPDAASLPLLTAALVLLSMATLWYVVKGIGKRIVAGRLYARYFIREDNELGSETRVLTESSLPRLPARTRLRSLDIFRGIAVALMIFVNAGGGGYAALRHAAWDGLGVADLVFPWFAFSMGAACALSLHARLAAGSRSAVFWQVVRRSLLLCLIGVCLGGARASWSTLRLPGVLQRLGLWYLLVGALECACARPQARGTGNSLVRDLVAGWRQWLVTLLLVAVQVSVSLSVAAPGCPRGYAGPGGLHRSAAGAALEQCSGGIAGYLDRWLFGAGRLYQRGAWRALYRAPLPHDPEGALGALSGALVAQAGAHATRVMLTYNHARARIMRWLLWAAVFGVSGGALCQFSQHGGPIPVNKSLWSLSYCLVSASTGFLITAVLYYAVDLKGRWGGRPFYYAGQNALFLYVASELLRHHFPFYYELAAPTHAQLLAAHAAAALLWLAVAVALHRRRVFITL